MSAEDRKSQIERSTKETQIKLNLDLDGSGQSRIDTGIGFFNHMLTHVAMHGLFDLEVEAAGDLEVDGHHTVEDVGISLGLAFKEAVGDKRGIKRYGSSYTPMDEALSLVVVDISNRPFLAYNVDTVKAGLGEFDLELAEEFMRAFAVNAGVTLHINLVSGSNLHHIVESVFKGLGRALRQAVERDERVKGVPSTKGVL